MPVVVRSLVVLSALTAALAAGWVSGAVPIPLVAPDDALALLVLPPARVAVLVLVAAALGLVLLVPRVRGDRRLLGPAAVAQLAVFGLAVQGITTIALLGYLLAFLLPAAGVVVGVQVVRRYPRLRPVVAVVVLAAIGWGIGAGVLAPDPLRQLGANLADGFAAAGGQLVASLLFTALAGGWAAVLVDAVRRTPTAERLTGWVRRHRVGITVVAALGPVPYALARATWLTPWPQFGGPVQELTPEIRLWGLLLGGAALLGAVLTVGLVRPWGEVFPRWMPGLPGRPVPLRVAAIPGGVVAAVLCLSAAPMAVAMLSNDGMSVLDRGLTLLVFPFGIWGPALALAVWGYVAERSAARQPVLAG